MKAKAAVFMGPEKDFEIREFEVTKTPKGYGQSELIASGICGTDVHMHRGKLAVGYPSIIGHEFVGRLTDLDEEEGKEYGLQVGDAVIADIAVPCGECILCKNGDDANCVNMKVTNGGSIEEAPYLYGGYTEVNYTPLTNLIKIPAELDPTMTATFACPGPTAIHACRLAQQSGVDLSNINVAVVQGLGPVGCFAVMYETEFVIATDADLYGFAALSANNDFAGKTVFQVEDIVANEGKAKETGWDKGTDGTEYPWVTIGTANKAFAGNFDGQGHTISGLNKTETSSAHVGLFGKTTTSSTIKNISVKCLMYLLCRVMQICFVFKMRRKRRISLSTFFKNRSGAR